MRENECKSSENWISTVDEILTSQKDLKQIEDDIVLNALNRFVGWNDWLLVIISLLSVFSDVRSCTATFYAALTIKVFIVQFSSPLIFHDYFYPL